MAVWARSTAVDKEWIEEKTFHLMETCGKKTDFHRTYKRGKLSRSMQLRKTKYQFRCILCHCVY